MPITKADCKRTREEEGTPGGVTYHITKRGRGQKEAPLCFRPLANSLTEGTGNRCTNTAGKGTWHVGEGACRKHGGNAGRPPTTGKYAFRARERLADRIEYFLEHDYDKLMRLDTELAALKLLILDFIEEFPSPDDKKFSIAVTRLTAMIQAAGSLVEKISRVESRNALTTQQVLYLRVTMADILMKYVPVEKRERAIAELAQRVGSSTQLMIEG